MTATAVRRIATTAPRTPAARAVLTVADVRGTTTMHPSKTSLAVVLCCAAAFGTSCDASDGWSTSSLASGGEREARSNEHASEGAREAVATEGDHDHDDDHDHDHDHSEENETGHHRHAHVILTPEIRRAASRILVLQSTRTDRTTEVVGVVDVHADSGDQDEALDELRAVTLAMGGDAVIGVEFHHGTTHGAPTHLSGLAVRFLSTIPLP